MMRASRRLTAEQLESLEANPPEERTPADNATRRKRRKNRKRRCKQVHAAKEAQVAGVPQAASAAAAGPSIQAATDGPPSHSPPTTNHGSGTHNVAYVASLLKSGASRYLFLQSQRNSCASHHPRSIFPMPSSAKCPLCGKPKCVGNASTDPLFFSKHQGTPRIAAGTPRHAKARAMHKNAHQATLCLCLHPELTRVVS
jgi:hypothetical protein